VLSLSLALCLACVLQGQVTPLENLGLEKGSLSGWEGQGFYLTGADPRGPGPKFALCSSDGGSRTRKGRLQRAFVVPAKATAIRFFAHAELALGCDPEEPLNVMLLRDGNIPVAKKVRSGSHWVSQGGLLPSWQRQSREYSWDVTNLAGQTVQIVLLDQDERPGCYVFCTGFQIIAQEGSPGAAPASSSSYGEFAAEMLKLQKKHNFTSLARFDSKRFVALGNASEAFTSQRLRYCEAFYDLFSRHFQSLGFSLDQPKEKLMVAIFDSHEGFEAYLGRKMPSGITGIYHPGTNRLVIYDLRGDPALIASKENALKKSRNPKDRQRVAGTIERQFNDLAQDINLATTMHEAAHQLSFNMGLLNRQGDVPVWLAEGLACYCEATNEGDWQALGSPNPGRIDDLRRALAKGKLMPLSQMIRSDDWLQIHPLLGYAQSWTLFRMLLHERPQALRSYLAMIYSRQASDHRLTDFLQAFGPDLEALESRFRDHVRELVEKVPPPKLR
jgi:hypothetical protein